MPKINDKVFCINHPDKEMDEYFDFILHNTEKGDDRKYYEANTAIIGVPFICSICRYMEMYAFTDAQDALAGRDNPIRDVVDDQSFPG